MLGFLEFYFFVIVFQNGVPVSVAEHTFKHLNVCQYVHSVMIAGAIKDNNLPKAKKKGLVTTVAPPGCARRSDRLKKEQQQQKGKVPEQKDEVEETEQDDDGS